MYIFVFSIRDIRKKIELRKEKEREKNNLESYIYDMKEKLESQVYDAVTTPQEREKFTEQLNTAGNWLYEEGADSDTQTYKDVSSSLKFVGDKIVKRKYESEERPKALAQFGSFLMFSKEVLMNISATLNITQEEFAEMLLAIDKAEKEIGEKATKQAALSPFEDPIFTVDEIFKKSRELDAKLRVLSRRPKKSVKKPEEPKVEQTLNEDDDGEDDEDDDHETNIDENENKSGDSAKNNKEHDEL
ncbi:MAG: Hsp70 family protein [Actinobacteria bacterium]|nr:Hsp70 family protein [Actinomycetota bacterium]